MGIEPFLIASTVRAVIGQRLVRRLCVECKEPYTPEDAQIKQIAKTFKIANASDMQHIHELEQQALEGGIGKPATGKRAESGELSTTPSAIKRLFKAHDDGCAACNHTGYKGRIGIYEVLKNTEGVQKLIVTNATSDVIQTAAIQEGMLTMQTDGFIKALRGETTIEEILRVTTEE
jgi:type II secretory ATPase GspE/PulE/Tfp pilus assembly ATPase PilB-like protein